MELLLDLLAHLIDGHIAALIGHLGHHHDGPPSVEPLSNSLGQWAALPARQAAHPKGLEDDRLVAVLQPPQPLRPHAGDQGKQQHPLLQLVIEGGLRPIHILSWRQVADQLAISDNANLRIIHAGKGVIALGPLLPGPSA